MAASSSMASKFLTNSTDKRKYSVNPSEIRVVPPVSTMSAASVDVYLQRQANKIWTEVPDRAARSVELIPHCGMVGRSQFSVAVNGCLALAVQVSRRVRPCPVRTVRDRGLAAEMSQPFRRHCPRQEDGHIWRCTAPDSACLQKLCHPQTYIDAPHLVQRQ